MVCRRGIVSTIIYSELAVPLSLRRKIMAVKSRKDSKGYALKTGECQRNDGRYSYSYTDRYGKITMRNTLCEFLKLSRQSPRSRASTDFGSLLA